MLALALLLACSADPGSPDTAAPPSRRTPAEWEPQEAVWLQWPHPWEGPGAEAALTRIAVAMADHEDVRVLVHDAAMERRAAAALEGVDRVEIHRVPTDSSWMRDNGPVYVEVDGGLVVQDWGFDAWGGGFGTFPYAADDAVPEAVAGILGLPLERVDLVHERGDLEVNGSDTAIASWSVLSHRNPDLDRGQITAILREALGVDSVVYTEGFHPDDGTRGHVDGMVRFVAEDAVLVGRDGSALLDRVADQVAEQRPDLRVDRLDSPHASLFLNYLVGDGFVLAGSSGNPDQDAAAAGVIGGYFPDREVHFVDIDALWRSGGGVHCVTNDQPAAPR